MTSKQTNRVVNETSPLLQKPNHGDKVSKANEYGGDQNMNRSEASNLNHPYQRNELETGRNISETELLKEEEEIKHVYSSNVYQITHSNVWSILIVLIFVISTTSLVLLYRHSQPPIDTPINRNDDRPMSVKFDETTQEYNVVDHHPLVFSPASVSDLMSSAETTGDSIRPSILASGKYLKNIHGNGWHYLSVKTLNIHETLSQNNTTDPMATPFSSPSSTHDLDKQHTLYFRSMKALGYLEGYLTCEDIILWYHNFYDGLFEGKDPQPEALEFLQANHDWMVSQANKYAYNNEYWYNVKGLLEQMEGLIIGMKEACPGTDVLSSIDIQQHQPKSSSSSSASSTSSDSSPTDILVQEAHSREYWKKWYNPWQENLSRASQDVFLPSMTKAPSLLHILLMNANGDLYQINEKFDRLNRTASASSSSSSSGKDHDPNTNPNKAEEPRDHIVRHHHHHHHRKLRHQHNKKRALLNEEQEGGGEGEEGRKVQRVLERLHQEKVWNRQAYREAIGLTTPSTEEAAATAEAVEEVKMGFSVPSSPSPSSFDAWMQSMLASQKIQHIYHNTSSDPSAIPPAPISPAILEDVVKDPESISHRYHHHLASYHVNQIDGVPTDHVSHDSDDDTDETDVVSNTRRSRSRSRSRRQLRHKVGPYQHSDHCSVLIKVLPHNADIVIAHNTWDDFQVAYPRIMKHYSYNLVSGLRSVGMYDLHFSSSPGLLSSVDDFFILHGHGHFIVTETSIDVYNDQLFHLVVPQSMLSYMRARVANSLAHSGNQWTDLFSLYASGTYVNSWMILDMTKYSLHTRTIEDSFFHVLEESPGYIHTADLTDHLRNTSYWASYNNPYFEDIARLSGQYTLCQGDRTQCYDTDPRGLLFAKYQDQLKTIEDVQDFIMYNGFDHDPESLQDSCNSISCREDLEPNVMKRYPFGAIDSKVSSIRLAQTPIRLSTPTIPSTPSTKQGRGVVTKEQEEDDGYIIPVMYAHLGPSNHNLPPFCWSNLARNATGSLVGEHVIATSVSSSSSSSLSSSDGQSRMGRTVDAITGSSFIHDGHPDCFNFTYEMLPPLDLLLPKTTTISLKLPK